ncbi:MAG: hypothetical protein WBQ94_05405 [Terracidiphilus sp.]
MIANENVDGGTRGSIWNMLRRLGYSSAIEDELVVDFCNEILYFVT